MHSTLRKNFSTPIRASRIEQRNVQTGEVQRTIPCGRYVSSLAIDDENGQLVATDFGRNRTGSSWLRISAGTERAARGYGFRQEPNGQLVATDFGRNRLLLIGLEDGKTRADLPVGCQPTSVALVPSQSLALVTSLLPSGPANAEDHASDVTFIDLKKRSVRCTVKLPLGSTAVCEIAITPDGKYACVPHVVGRFNLPTTQLDRGWVNTNALTLIDIPENRLAGTLLLDEVMRGAADPWGVAIHPTNPVVYVSLSGVHEMAVVSLDAARTLVEGKGLKLVNDLAALQNAKAIERIPIPANGPRGIAVAPDGISVALAGYFSGNLVVTNASGAGVRQVPLGPQPEPAAERLGEAAFHDASDCFQTWLSCATCHPDVRADGLNWDLLNDGVGNPKNTRTMLWSSRTPPCDGVGSAIRYPYHGAGGLHPHPVCPAGRCEGQSGGGLPEFDGAKREPLPQTRRLPHRSGHPGQGHF